MGRTVARFALLGAGAALSLLGCESPPRQRSACPTLVEAREWSAARLACVGARWGPYADILNGWERTQTMRTDDPRALDEAQALIERHAGHPLEPDALLIAGNIYGRMNVDKAVNEGRARDLMMQSLAAYQQRGDHGGASTAALFMLSVARPGSRFADALEAADLAVSEAQLTDDKRALGSARTALGEAYDDLGMAEDARGEFVVAEELLKPWPAKLGYAYLKHGTFLLDSGDFPHAVEFLELARTELTRARTAGEPIGHQHWTGVHLNRAFALALLGQFDAATAELEAIPAQDKDEQCKLDLVAGHIAARRGDLTAAQRHYDAAGVCDLDADYSWRLAFEIGEVHRRNGDAAAAATAYEASIDAVETVRAQAGELELRPWVLAARAAPYHALFRLRAEQRRGFDALVVAESLQGRAWLDAVLGKTSRDLLDTDAALASARLSQRTAAPPLDRATLLARIGDREALVFVQVEGRLWRIHVRGGDATIDELPTTAAGDIAAFMLAPGDSERAERAAQVLVSADLAASDAPLYLVANGTLSSIPFAALRRNGRFLVEERPLARLPSLAALECRGGSWTDRRVFIGDALGNLPAARAEVQRLSGGTAKVGAAATLAAVFEARDAAYLHIAGHARVTRAGGVIALAHDSELPASEIIENDIRPRTVVLTACGSGASDDAEAWGGFPSAFLTAGSLHVVASLRTVDDGQAARFAERYDGAPATLDPVHRLAEAQRTMIRNGDPLEAWASFAVWGAAECK